MKISSIVMTLTILAAPGAALAETPGVPSDPASLAKLLKLGEPAESPAAAPSADTPVVSSAKDADAASPIQSITTMFGVAFGLAGLFVAGAFVMKRLKSKGMFDAANQELRLEESLWVGKGQRLLLVSVGERRVLLGVTGAGFEGLAVLDQEVEHRGLSAEPEVSVLPATPRLEDVSADRPKRKFAEVLNDDDVFKPSPSDRRRIIQRLNTL